MLNVFVGADTVMARAEARKLSQKTEVVFVGDGGEPYERVLSFVSSQGLFSQDVSLIIDRPFENPEGKNLISEHAEELHKSGVKIFVITPTLSAVEKKLFPRGVEIKSFDQKGTKEETRPNVFAFTDSFLSGDRKKTWINYRRLIISGISPEEIHGALMWAIRSALLAGKSPSAAQSGLKPFVFTKSKRAVERIGVEKVEDMSRTLVFVYHSARAGEGNMELGLEQMILEKHR